MHNNPSDPRAQRRPLVTAPFQKLEKATVKYGVLELHQKMQCHQLALEAGIAIIRSVQKPKETLPLRISTQNQEMFEKKNMNALRAIVSTIILCGITSLLEAIEMTAQARHPTKATFMPFLCYWATLIKIFKNTYLLVGEMVQAPQKLYKSKSSASLESIFGRKLHSRFRGKTPFFSIIVDEVTDKYANQEILSVCLWFLDLNNDVLPKIKEVFYTLSTLTKQLMKA